MTISYLIKYSNLFRRNSSRFPSIGGKPTTPPIRSTLPRVSNTLTSVIGTCRRKPSTGRPYICPCSQPSIQNRRAVYYVNNDLETGRRRPKYDCFGFLKKSRRIKDTTSLAGASPVVAKAWDEMLRNSGYPEMYFPHPARVYPELSTPFNLPSTLSSTRRSAPSPNDFDLASERILSSSFLADEVDGEVLQIGNLIHHTIPKSHCWKEFSPISNCGENRFKHNSVRSVSFQISVTCPSPDYSVSSTSSGTPSTKSFCQNTSTGCQRRAQESSGNEKPFDKRKSQRENQKVKDELAKLDRQIRDLFKGTPFFPTFSRNCDRNSQLEHV